VEAVDAFKREMKLSYWSVMANLCHKVTLSVEFP
jgi:hypothetical protein